MHNRKAKRSVALAAAALLALPAVALAQDTTGTQGDSAPGQRSAVPYGYGMMGYGMMGGGYGMGMMGSPAGAILAQKDALGLTTGQVARLDSLQQQSSDAWRAHWTLMQGIHEQMGKLSGSKQSDVEQYQKLMQQMASSGAAMHVQIAKLGEEALQVLTPDQRSKLDASWRSGGWGGMPGRHGMYGGGYRGMMGPGHMMGPGYMMGPGSMGYGSPCGAGPAGPGR